MRRTCEACGHSYNDEYSYTLCPHVPLGAGPAPFDPIRNPGGYCKEHDLFACTFTKHRGDKMPADKPFQVALAEAEQAIRVLSDFIGGRVHYATNAPFSAPESPAADSDPGMPGLPGFRPLRGAMQGDMRPKTAGIPPATQGPLAVLQFKRWASEPNLTDTVREAAREIASYHKPTEDQAQRHRLLSLALEDFLVYIVQACPPGPERSTAISWARASKMFAAAAISLE